MGTNRRNEGPQVEGDFEVEETIGHGSATNDQSQAAASLDQAQRRLQESMTKAKDKTEEAGHSLAGPLDE
jgi:hypothetical protein